MGLSMLRITTCGRPTSGRRPACPSRRRRRCWHLAGWRSFAERPLRRVSDAGHSPGRSGCTCGRISVPLWGSDRYMPYRGLRPASPPATCRRPFRAEYNGHSAFAVRHRCAGVPANLWHPLRRLRFRLFVCLCLDQFSEDGLDRGLVVFVAGEGEAGFGG